MSVASPPSPPSPAWPLPPDLPSPRFAPPEGWQRGEFTNPETRHRIHYGYALPRPTPQRGKPSALVVALPGLSEFTEKYYELAHDMLERGYGFACLDWHYQGRSGRHPHWPQRRHSDGFGADIADLDLWIRQHLIPAVTDEHGHHPPLVMIGHSMGGNLGLRYLYHHRDVFSAAAFSAPLLGIYRFGWPLRFFACCTRLLRRWIGGRYVPNGRDWHEAMRKSDGSDKFSSDPVRDRLHALWSRFEPALQVGSPTYEWALEALKACAFILSDGTIEEIEIPLMLASAGKDEIVDNEAIAHAAARLKNATHIHLEEARHEILMERDEIRDKFLKGFDNLLQQHNIG